MNIQKKKILVLLTFLLLFCGGAVFMYMRYVTRAPKNKNYIIKPRTDYDPIKVDSALKHQKGYKF